MPKIHHDDDLHSRKSIAHGLSRVKLAEAMSGSLVYKASLPKNQQPTTKRPNLVAKRTVSCTQQSAAGACSEKK